MARRSMASHAFSRSLRVLASLEGKRGGGERGRERRGERRGERRREEEREEGEEERKEEEGREERRGRREEGEGRREIEVQSGMHYHYFSTSCLYFVLHSSNNFWFISANIFKALYISPRIVLQE